MTAINDDTSDLEGGTPLYTEFASPHVVPVGTLKTEKPRGASLSVLLLLAMPRMAVQMAWSAKWAALGPYLGTMMPKWAVQLAQFTGPLSGILVAPTAGVLSDSSTSKWGRRRPFMLSAAVASVVCWICMGYTREMGEACGDYGDGSPDVPTSRHWTVVFTLVFYTWMDITVNIVQTAVLLLVADFAGDRQTTGAAFGQGWATLGSIFVSGYIQIWGPAHLTLHYFLGMLCVVMLVTVGAVCVVANETPLEPRPANANAGSKRIRNAFFAIYKGLRTLPDVLVVYALILFCGYYSDKAYNGNKGQFFGFEVYNGDAKNADHCGSACTEAQRNYNHGVRVAGGSTDLLFNGVGYVFSWLIPTLVAKLGAKRVITLFLLPQTLFMVMAFTKVVAIDVTIVVMTSLSMNVLFALVVPIIIHVVGAKTDIGMYVGALNSANCFGQLLNFAIGTALVETSLGYKLPVFLGGVMSLVGVIIGAFFLKLDMHSM